MWFEQTEKEKFVQGVIEEIMHESTPMDKLAYYLQNMREREIKSKVYKLLNHKVKQPYPMNIRALYDERLKNEIKKEFFRGSRGY